MERKFPYIPLGLSRKFPTVLPLVMLSRNFLNINHDRMATANPSSELFLSVEDKYSEFGTTADRENNNDRLFDETRGRRFIIGRYCWLLDGSWMEDRSPFRDD